MEVVKSIKPLGQKAYGSIPHLPGSRVGPGDYHISEGQAKIATEKRRDKYDLIIVQEKLDGSNVAVAKIDGLIYALTRAGYLANTSQYEQHQLFANYVKQNEERFYNLLNNGERVCGEWLALAHGTRYKLDHEPFVPFDIITGKERLTYELFKLRVSAHFFTTPALLSVGDSYSIDQMKEEIKYSGHGAIDEVEGAVWRVERKGKVDFLCKYVVPEKKDGKYFDEITGNGAVWNIDVLKYKI